MALPWAVLAPRMAPVHVAFWIGWTVLAGAPFPLACPSQGGQDRDQVLATYQLGVSGAVEIGVAQVSWLMTVTAEASSSSPRRWAAMAS
jgi:hypothetical protein